MGRFKSIVQGRNEERAEPPVNFDRPFVLGNPEDELLATVMRGLLSRPETCYFHEFILPESERPAWKLVIDAEVVMDRKHMEAIERAAETG
jgi:hypothetical protein